MDPPPEPGRNVLIGYGAALPEGVTHDAVVLGSAASTVYLGGAAVSASAAALTLGGSTTLVAGGSAGTAGQILQSTGTGVQWAAATAAVTAARTFTADETVSSSYSVYVYAGMATATLTLPAVGTSPTLVGVAPNRKRRHQLADSRRFRRSHPETICEQSLGPAIGHRHDHRHELL